MSVDKAIVAVSLTISEPELVSEGVYKVALTHPLLGGELFLIGSLTTIETLLKLIDRRETHTSDNSIESVIASLFELAALAKAIKQGG